MSNRKVTQENNNYKNKYHENKFKKKNKQSDIRDKRNNKNFFLYQDSIVNELPSGSFDKNNKIHPEIIEQNNEQINEQNIEQVNKQVIEQNIEQVIEQKSLTKKKDDIELTNLSDEEYEQYSPDYFEPQVYKK